MRRNELRLALPSKGELEEPTLDFLGGCGLRVIRASARSYTGSIATLPPTAVLFQRAADIPAKVEEGSADLGITGYDIVMEFRREGSELVMVVEDLGYSRCELVLAVPNDWIDVFSLADLRDLSAEMWETGRELRVATKFPRLTQRFLLAKGLTNFSLVESSGALEAAPTMGYADIISDLTSSGTTLRENRLKTIAGGTVLRAQACLIGNRRSLHQNPVQLATTEQILELIDARAKAEGFYSITANIHGESAEAVAQHLIQRPETAGLQGPTIAPVFSKTGGEGWYAVTVVVPTKNLLVATQHLRRMGGQGITVIPSKYIFEDTSPSFQRLLQRLEGDDEDLV